MRRSAIGNILVLALIVGALTWNMLAPDRGTAGTSVRMEPEHVEVLDLQEGDVREIPFRIHNQASAPRTFRVKSSCSCSGAPKEPITVPGGSTVEFVVRADTRLTPGSNVAVLELFESDGPFVARSFLAFASTPPLVLEPRALVLRPGAAAEVTVFAIGKEPPDLALGAVHPDVDAALDRISARRWRVRASARDGDAPAAGLQQVQLVAKATGETLVNVPIAVELRSASGALRPGFASRPHADGGRELGFLVTTAQAEAVRILSATCAGRAIAAATSASADGLVPGRLLYPDALRHQDVTVAYAVGAARHSATFTLP